MTSDSRQPASLSNSVVFTTSSGSIDGSHLPHSSLKQGLMLTFILTLPCMQQANSVSGSVSISRESRTVADFPLSERAEPLYFNGSLTERAPDYGHHTSPNTNNDSHGDIAKRSSLAHSLYTYNDSTMRLSTAEPVSKAIEAIRISSRRGLYARLLVVTTAVKRR